MGILEAIILGIIQGLTEFLPVSSSGHLELAKAILGEDSIPNPEESMLFTVVLHGATAMATVVVFWDDVKSIFVGLFQFKKNEAFLFSMRILISMIPAAIVGLLFEDVIESFFSGNVILVGAMLFVTGILLFLADRAKVTTKSVGNFEAFLIGVAQAIAILPGISRSGATISTSVLLGIDKNKAARFSFLMVVPLILGKMAKDILDGAFLSINTIEMSPLLLGFVAAFITGIFACKWMIRIVKRSKLTSFAIYCFIIGAIALGFGLFY